MTDFWIAVLLTSVVSLLTVLSDWIASRMIFTARAIRSIRGIAGSGLTPPEIARRVSEEIERYQTSQSNSLAWGSDLATVAVSFDFATLGIWIHNSNFFPFFSRFNSQNVSREIPVWLIIIGVHIVMLVLSLAMKHKHGEAMGSLPPVRWAAFPSRLWFSQNAWMLSGNLFGFVSLLSCIVITTNAL